MTPITFGKGFNFDLPASELAPGVWSSGSNFRFVGGIDEMWEGAGLYYSSGANVPLWGLPCVLNGTRVAFYATSSKGYTRTTTTTTEVTRYTDGVLVSNATAVGTTVTITTVVAHGLSTGNIINAYGFTPSTYDANAVAITVTGATTFTYTVASAPATSPVTTIGAYSGNATSNFSVRSSYGYTGGVFNGLLLFNHPNDGLYYLSSSTSILRKVPRFKYDATNWATAAAVRTFKSFIIVLGVNGYRQAVNWSNSISDPSSLPSTFTASNTNLAGGTILAETVGNAVDCLPLGEVNIVYMTDARYAMQYLEGSTAVFQFTRLPGNSGLLTANCVVTTPMGHVFLTPDFDVMAHNGGEAKSIASNRVKKHLKASISADISLCFLAVNPAKSEVWVCYPSTSTTGCDKALVWNWVDDTWGKFDLVGSATSASAVTFGVEGIWPGVDQDALGMFAYHAVDSTKTGIYYSATAVGSMFGAPITGTLIREGMDMGDRDRMKALQRSRWNIDATAGDTVTVYHGSSKFADTAATYAAGVSYTVGTTDYANARATHGRFLALKLVTATVASTLRFRTCDLDFTLGGTR